MRSPRQKFTYLFILLLVSFFPPFSGAELSDEEREAKEEELLELRQRIKNLSEERKAVKSQYDRVQRTLRKTERAIAAQLRELKKLDKKLKRQKNKLVSLRRHQAGLHDKVKQQRGLLGQQIRTAYMIGRQEYLKLLLNQEDPAALGRTMTYYDYFNREREKNIKLALQTLLQLDKVALQIEEESGKLLALKDTELAEKQKLEEVKSQRLDVVARLAEEMKDHDSAIKNLRDNENQLQALLDAIEDILTAPDEHKKFSTLGKLPWPVKGKVNNLYGRARLNGKLKWNGVLIRASEGTPVYAVARGRVAYADWLRGYGLLLILDHGDGYMSLYGQNQSLNKEVGDWVEADEVVANVGSSGGQERSALYFEIRHNGLPKNPAKWCALARRQS